MVDRLTLPATTTGSAAAIGYLTAAATLVLSHPVFGFGLRAWLLAATGGLTFAAGLILTDRRSPLRLAVGAVLVFGGVTLVLGGLFYAGRAAPPIAIIAAWLSIGGVLYLSLAVVGHTDPASLAAYDGVLWRWLGSVLAVALGTLALLVLGIAARMGIAGGAVSTYVAVVGQHWTDAVALLVVHALVSTLLGLLLRSQLLQLGLIKRATAQRALRWLLGTVGLFVGLLIATAVVESNPSLLGQLADVVPILADAVSSIRLLARAHAFHGLVLGVELLVTAAILLCVVLRLVRATSLRRAGQIAGYLAGPLAAVALVVVGLGLAPAMTDLDPYSVLGLRPWYGPGGTRMQVPLGIQAGLASAVTFSLFGAVIASFLGTRLVFGVIYRFSRRGLPAAASAGLVAGASFLGVTGTRPLAVAACLVGGFLTWDLLENGVGLGEQLGGRFVAVRSEVAHTLASGAVGGLALVLGLGTYELTTLVGSGEAPSLLVLGLLLAAAVAFALFLRRA